MLLYQSCNIYNNSEVLVNWNTTPSRVIVYSNIKCKFWSNSSISLWETNLSREDNKWKYNLVIEWDKNLVRSWYVVELLTDTIWSLWSYLIDEINEHHSVLSWAVDNFHLMLSKSND